MKAIAHGMPPEALKQYIDGLSGYDAQGIKKEGIKFEQSLAAQKGLLAGTPTPAQKQAILDVRASIKDEKGESINLNPHFQQVEAANKGKPAEKKEALKTEPENKPTPTQPSTKTQATPRQEKPRKATTPSLRAETTLPLERRSAQAASEPPPPAERTDTLDPGQCSQPTKKGLYVCIDKGGGVSHHRTTADAGGGPPPQVESLRVQTAQSPEALPKDKEVPPPHQKLNSHNDKGYDPISPYQ